MGKKQGGVSQFIGMGGKVDKTKYGTSGLLRTKKRWRSSGSLLMEIWSFLDDVHGLAFNDALCAELNAVDGAHGGGNEASRDHGQNGPLELLHTTVHTIPLPESSKARVASLALLALFKGIC